MLPVNSCGMSFAYYTSEPNDKGVPRWSFRKFNVEAYRETSIEDCSKATYHFLDETSRSRVPENYNPNDIKYEQLPVVNWLFEKYLLLVELNQNAKTINAFYKFKEPVTFDFGTVSLLVSAYELSLQVKTVWMSQIITVDASVGIYDFIQHRTIMPPGQQQYILNGVDFDKGKPIDFIPVEKPREMNENRFYLSVIKNGISKIEGVGTPDLDSLVGEEILTVDGEIRKNIHKPLKENAVRAASGIERLVTPIQGERIKLGRNEPCYCGSGKKYKKCHGK